MDYEPSDSSSGTDDDIPPSHENRIARGGRVAGNGRTAIVDSVPYPRGYEEFDMEAQIHHLEQEAYSSVLRAFKAQADAITWEKESLMTELRKELRLSNDEHGELLGRVNADDVIRSIREWRLGGGVQPGMFSNGQAVLDSAPSPTVSASRKKQKINQSVLSQSYGGPSPFHQQIEAASSLPSSAVARRGSTLRTMGKKHKSGTSSGPTVRNQIGDRPSSGSLAYEPAEAPSYNSLVGRKVRTRWPDDNHFYEAVITDYNAAEGRHALVYDIGTARETWEWVNLAEISPEDIQWEDEDPRISHNGVYGGAGHGMNRSVGHDRGPGARSGRGTAKGQLREEFPPSQSGIGKEGADDIQILHTGALITEVEKVCGASHPDPLEIEKAKKLLKEHEQALADAIAMLGDLSDEEGGHFLHRRAMDVKG